MMSRPTYLAQSRAIVGESVPIVVLLDMHGNISPRLVELADVLLAYDANPHIDTHARGVEAAQIMNRVLSREIRPTAASRASGLAAAATEHRHR